MDLLSNVVAKVRRHISEAEAIAGMLGRAGPRLVAHLTKHQSLRCLAAKSGLSPCYLSQVANSRQVISKSAFVRLAELASKEAAA